MLASSGLADAPCGVPATVSITRPSSSTPACSHFRSRRMILRGSIRVGYWDWACGGQEPGSRGTWRGRPLQGPSPAEIVRQVARRDAVEAPHPALQPAVVGVHVLDVEGPVADADAGREIDRLVVQPVLGGEGGVGLGAIRA